MDVLPYTNFSYTFLYIRQNGCIRLIHPFCQTKKYILTCLGATFNSQTFPFFLQISNFLSQSFSFCQILWNTFQLKLFKYFPTNDNKIWKPFCLKIWHFKKTFLFEIWSLWFSFKTFLFKALLFSKVCETHSITNFCKRFLNIQIWTFQLWKSFPFKTLKFANFPIFSKCFAHFPVEILHSFHFKSSHLPKSLLLFLS